VESDNDGEMLVHTIEHYFDNELNRYTLDKQQDIDFRRICLRKSNRTGI